MENSVNPKTEDKKVPQKQTGNLKKKVKDYFFDFFMLFLAVTLGFFVNNLSEDQSERKREKQYMESLFNTRIAFSRFWLTAISIMIAKSRQLIR